MTRRILTFLLLLSLLAACNLPVQQVPLAVKPGAAQTYAVETLSVQRTDAARIQKLTAEALARRPTLYPTSTTVNVYGTPSPSATLGVPTLTPVQPTFFPTSDRPLIVATVDTNCRLGPHKAYDRLGFLLAGQASYVYGSNADQTWWYIENPELSGQFCWVWADSTVVTGDVTNVPVLTPIPIVMADFDLSYANTHSCGFDKYITFRVKSLGALTFYKATVTVVTFKDNNVVAGPKVNQNAYMDEKNDCPPGVFNLDAGKTGFIPIKKTDTVPKNMKLRAYVELCTEPDDEMVCIEKDVTFVITSDN